LKFSEKLEQTWKQSDSLLCVGLDPDIARFPASLQRSPQGLLQFCQAIVDATGDLVCAFKPQIAYFGSVRAEAQLEELIAYIHHRWPSVPVILDAKRGDIGPTAEHYAKEVFDRFRADAVTLSPYMGFDSIAPYLAYTQKGLILLCRTSNPGGEDLQMQKLQNGERLFERVARLAAGPWNTSGQLALVVGATYPEQLAAVRAIAPTLPILVPGIGAQGGDIQASVKAGIDAQGGGLMVSSSRAILYASDGSDFQEAARAAAIQTRDALRAAALPARPL
jgi:orotidine-5'-phosphate decarboxylase